MTISRRAFSIGSGAAVAAGTISILSGASPTAASVTSRIDCGANKPENPGLVADDAYQGPTYAQTITWDADRWEVGDVANLAVSLALKPAVEPVDCGIGNGGSDLLTLSHRDWETSVVLIQAYQVGMWTFENMIESARHPGWVANLRLPEGSEVLIADVGGNSIVTLARDAENSTHVVYQQHTFPDGAPGEPGTEDFIRSITVHLWEPDAYAQTLDDLAGIAIEAFDPFIVIDPETVLAAIG